MTAQFLLVLILTASINTGMGIIIPILPSLLKHYGFSTIGLSLPFLVLILARVFSKWSAGWFMKRFSSRVLLMVCYIIYIIVFALYPHFESPLQFILIRCLEGLVEGLSIVCLTDIAIALSGKNRGKLMGYFSASFGVGFILGPFIGGTLYSFYGKDIMFMGGVGIGCIGLACAFLLKQIQKHPKQEMQRLPFFLALRGYIRFVPYYLPQILRRSLFFSFMIALPLYVVDVLKMSEASVAKFFFVSAIITTLFMPLTGAIADRFSAQRVVFFSLVLMGFLIFGFSLAKEVSIFTALFIAETVFFAIMLPASMKVFGDIVEDYPDRGAIIGVFSGLTEWFTVVLAVAVPILYSMTPAAVWILLGCLCLIAAAPFANMRTSTSTVNS